MSAIFHVQLCYTQNAVIALQVLYRDALYKSAFYLLIYKA